MSKNYRKLTEQIIFLVGGKENIKTVANCATRLRFYLGDEAKAKTEELKKTDGIAGVVKNGGQYQVIIGPDVDLVMEEIKKLGGIKVEGGTGTSHEEKEKLTWKNAFGKFLGTVSTIFIPIIPCLAGAGILQAILILLKTAGIVPEDNQTYVMLNMVSGAVFYYLPVMLAFSSAKVFKCNQYMAAVMSFMLLHPTFMGSNVAQGAAAFVVCLKSKKSGKKQMAFSSAISALIGGITEPALYGITLKYKSVLWSVMLGGGVAGLWAGFSRMRTYSPGPASVLGLPCYVGGDSLQNVINAAIAIVISVAVTVVAMLVFGMKDVRKAEENEEETDTELDDLMEI